MPLRFLEAEKLRGAVVAIGLEKTGTAAIEGLDLAGLRFRA